MAHHDIVAIGASSGGVQALTVLLSSLPADLQAALFVVLHVNPDAPSQLPAILNRAGALPAAHAVDGEPIRRGRVYVAPPGMQTYLQPGRMAVKRGPQENLYRPAIDPLFRTAAHHYGARTIGVVLSGALDDGAAGLRAIKEAGGLAIVQEPDDAEVPGMPLNALERVKADYCVRMAAMGPLIAELTSRSFSLTPLAGEVPLETTEEAQSPATALRSDQLGHASAFTCPDCSGTLFEIHEGGQLRYRCRVGHAYSDETMVLAQGASTERALWTALRALEERVAMLRKLAERGRRRGLVGVARVFDDRAAAAEQDVRAVHGLILDGSALDDVGHENL
ncbi:MAG TPA: chemotaxis protein CheB [Vicinamibacterales bacterium]|jgi:two-component system chemotaxis response regulator CheB|nr:chemotaxis protein CheB [Vicinamibacterales bacterium]